MTAHEQNHSHGYLKQVFIFESTKIDYSSKEAYLRTSEYPHRLYEFMCKAENDAKGVNILLGQNEALRTHLNKFKNK
jgi:hypothetical protein